MGKGTRRLAFLVGGHTLTHAYFFFISLSLTIPHLSHSLSLLDPVCREAQITATVHPAEVITDGRPRRVGGARRMGRGSRGRNGEEKDERDDGRRKGRA